MNITVPLFQSVFCNLESNGHQSYALDVWNNNKGVLLKKKYLLILFCVVIMLFNELAR